MLGHGKDRSDGSESEGNIGLKVWRISRVPIFRVAESHDYIDNKAPET